MNPIHPTGKQQKKVLQALLDANGQWVSKRYFIQTLMLTQAGARIYELENDFHWPIEHSDFTDEYGFRSYRIVQQPETMSLLDNQQEYENV